MHFQCGLCVHQPINQKQTKKNIYRIRFFGNVPKVKETALLKTRLEKWSWSITDLGGRDHTSWSRTQNTRTDRLASAGSFSLGQTQPALASAEYGVVMSDEDVTQDPHVIIRWSEAGSAAVGRKLQGIKPGFEIYGKLDTKPGRGQETCTWMV